MVILKWFCFIVYRFKKGQRIPQKIKLLVLIMFQLVHSPAFLRCNMNLCNERLLLWSPFSSKRKAKSVSNNVQAGQCLNFRDIFSSFYSVYKFFCRQGFFEKYFYNCKCQRFFQVALNYLFLFFRISLKMNLHI